ncbi:GyrI-like domain-containing protein [Chungangia koreensis]|uniref:GyrI-like domain-containing protein n=1 Tax=Chungangia koreensis TaxID=752657 RepID=A0ABV8X0X1_9LACT
MSVEQKKEFEIVSKEEFLAIGFKWEGTFAEAADGGIRRIQAELKNRLEEISGKVNPETLLGLSYHASENSEGFTHYAAVEVSNADSVPEGMVSISVPANRYAQTDHRKGESVVESYNQIYIWIREQGMEASQSGLTHFEKYPMAQDPFSTTPAFTIMIPIETA